MASQRPSTVKLHELRVDIPRGFADYWQIIRELDAAGPWTIGQIAGHTRSHHEVIGRYVQRLAKADFASVVGFVGGTTPNAAHLYRLNRTPAEAPRVREDGTECPPTGQEQMWRAMRSLQQFDARELAFSASTDVVAVSIGAAKSYCARLTAAGYLAVVQPAKGGKASRLAIWRLRPAMNTGPLPPIVMRTRFVWDQNRGAIAGAATATAEES